MTESTSTPAPLSDNDKKHKLAIAVQALTEVANTLEDGSNPTVSQKSFDDKIDRQQSQLSNLQTKIEELNLEMKENNRLLKEQAKIKLMELALSRSHFGEFEFYRNHEEFIPYLEESGNLVESIIDCFIMGKGTVLPKNASMHKRLEKDTSADCLEDAKYSDDESLSDDIVCNNESCLKCQKKKARFESGKKEFRKKIVEQVEFLIGKKPRLVERKNDVIVIFYD